MNTSNITNTANTLNTTNVVNTTTNIDESRQTLMSGKPYNTIPLTLSTLTLPITFKNYKTLCQTLSLPILAGKQKTYQLRELQRYADFTKNPNKQSYTVTTIYPSPLPKTDNRTNNGHATYLSHIQPILLSLLSTAYNTYGLTEVGITKNNLFYSLGMVNNNYVLFCNKRITINTIQDDTHLKMPHNILNNFLLVTKNKLTSILTSCLNSLIKKSIISCHTEMIGKRGYTWQKKYNTLTSDEIEKINAIKKETLEKYENSSIYSLICQNKYSQYIMSIHYKVKNELGYHYIFPRYVITYLTTENNNTSCNVNMEADANVDNNTGNLTDEFDEFDELITENIPTVNSDNIEEAKHELNTIIQKQIYNKLFTLTSSNPMLSDKKKGEYIKCYTALIKLFISISDDGETENNEDNKTDEIEVTENTTENTNTTEKHEEYEEYKFDDDIDNILNEVIEHNKRK